MPFQGTNASSNLAGDTAACQIRLVFFECFTGGTRMQTFTGFSDDTIRFLGELTVNNVGSPYFKGKG